MRIPMKNIFATLLLVLLAFHSNAGAKDSDPSKAASSLERQKYEDAYKQYSQAVATVQAQQKQQAEEYAKQMAIVQSQASQQQEMIEKGKAILAQQEISMAKQTELQERFSKILDMWERQQEQYQKYLNNLTSGK